MINTVYNLLIPIGIPCRWQDRPDFSSSNTVISYHFFGDGPEDFGEGEYQDESGSCQIDIFSKGNYSNIVEQVKSRMKQGSFLFAPSPGDTIEEVDGIGKIYHKVLIFNYMKSEVLNNG